MALISPVYRLTPNPAYDARDPKKSKKPQWLRKKIHKAQFNRGKRRKWMNQQAGQTIAFKPKKAKHQPNACEALFTIKAEQAGWTVSHKGWPDFMCWRDGQVCAVEVKPDVGSTQLRQEQKDVMKTLASFGIPCYKWSPEKGFEKIIPEIKFES